MSRHGSRASDQIVETSHPPPLVVPSLQPSLSMSTALPPFPTHPLLLRLHLVASTLAAILAAWARWSPRSLLPGFRRWCQVSVASQRWPSAQVPLLRRGCGRLRRCHHDSRFQFRIWAGVTRADGFVTPQPTLVPCGCSSRRDCFVSMPSTLVYPVHDGLWASGVWCMSVSRATGTLLSILNRW